jgi:hypothetical protein
MLFDGCEDKTRESPDEVVLALRKWYDLRAEREFRAFVFGKALLGICQGEVTGLYPALVDCLDQFEFALADFFHQSIRDQFDGWAFVMKTEEEIWQAFSDYLIC